MLTFSQTGHDLRPRRFIAHLKSVSPSVLQLPEWIEVTEELPMTKIGKVYKKKLREEIKKKMEQEETV